MRPPLDRLALALVALAGVLLSVAALALADATGGDLWATALYGLGLALFAAAVAVACRIRR